MQVEKNRNEKKTKRLGGGVQVEQEAGRGRQWWRRDGGGQRKRRLVLT